MSISAVQNFCIEFGLPDISLLISADLPKSERVAVVWNIMKSRISPKRQRDFLHEFCKNSSNRALQLFCTFVSADIDDEKCNDVVKIILATEGAVDSFGESLRHLCNTRQCNSTATLIDKSGLENIVFLIEPVFKVKDEHMMVALDHLKYDTNPERFTRHFDRFVKTRDASFKEKMNSLDARLEELKLEAATLSKQLEDLRSTGVSKRQRPARPVV